MTSPANESNEIVDDEAHQRFVIRFDDSIAILTYRIVGKRFLIDHTGVPPHHSGEGIGSRLVVAAIKKATAAGLTVVPNCSFARWWIDEHAGEFAELTANS